MCVARCLLSWLLFAATTEFFVYFGVKRLITIIIDNLYDVVVYIFVFSLVKFQVGSCVNKEEELDCRVPCLLFPHIPTVREHVDIYNVILYAVEISLVIHRQHSVLCHCRAGLHQMLEDGSFSGGQHSWRAGLHWRMQ